MAVLLFLVSFASRWYSAEALILRLEGAAMSLASVVSAEGRFKLEGSGRCLNSTKLNSVGAINWGSDCCIRVSAAAQEGPGHVGSQPSNVVVVHSTF